MNKKFNIKLCVQIIVFILLFGFAAFFGVGSDYVLEHADKFEYLSTVYYQCGDKQFTAWHFLLTMKVCFATILIVILCWLIIKWCLDGFFKYHWC